MKLLKILPLWRLLLLILAGAGMFTFLIPLIGGIRDVSNLGAATVFGLLALILLFWKPFLRILGFLWLHLWGRVLVTAVFLGAALTARALVVLSVLVMTGMSASPERECRTLIVLGCQVRGTRPSALLACRIAAAGEYMEEHPDCVAILSGGQGTKEEISEAECMYRALTARGIDPKRLYKEESSTVTLENLSRSQELMERRGLKGPVLIVSNSFHIYRALQMAEDLGLDAEGLAAASLWYSTPTYILREAMALIKYHLVG